jgi:uncharacterized Rmd1/YagE family protein
MKIVAVNIPPKIKLKEITKELNYFCLRSSGYEVIYKIADDSFIILYSFGAYTLINVEQAIANEFKQAINHLVPLSNELTTDDNYEVNIVVDSPVKVEHNRITLPSFKLEYVRLISLVLAESVAMDYYELITDDILEKSLNYTRELRDTGRFSIKKKDLLKFIGNALTIRQKILSNLYITDSPEETWNSPELEKLFFDLVNMFDIEQRFRGINMSLNAIQESLEVITNWSHNAHSNRLEWYIIALIFVEIVLGLIR